MIAHYFFTVQHHHEKDNKQRHHQWAKGLGCDHDYDRLPAKYGDNEPG